jgi:hypothetical protein
MADHADSARGRERLGGGHCWRSPLVPGLHGQSNATARLPPLTGWELEPSQLPALLDELFTAIEARGGSLREEHERDATHAQEVARAQRRPGHRGQRQPATLQ